MRHSLAAIAALSTAALHAQWTIQASHTTASLRGIHSLGAGIAWASGTNGVVLRTLDGGDTWQPCSVPPGAQTLDFRGIQAFDQSTAIVMSSGPGDLSRVYLTTDACRTWTLTFTNPDKEGFWDAIQFPSRDFGILIGDQVGGSFPLFVTTDQGRTWKKQTGIAALAKNQAIFAASNSAVLASAGKLYVITGGGTTSVFEAPLPSAASASHTNPGLAVGETAGGFSLASKGSGSDIVIVAVGGDYKSPDATAGTAAMWTKARWQTSQLTPGGYRSAVAYDPRTNTWITVGPNGTDLSTDDGRTWHPLKPAAGEPPDAARNWNALSLPFVVGPNCRIGKRIDVRR